VFQNNGEFVAGYLEGFFRNPNYMSAQNPDLFSAYQELFGYDPRRAWKQDYPNYVKKNRDFYSKGEKPPKAGLTIPED
jgi:Mlc titration factor MtfA (ptsG expression regulator)